MIATHVSGPIHLCVLDDRLDQQVGRHEVVHRRHAGERLLGVHTALLRELLEAAPHRPEPALDRARERVVQGHPPPRGGYDLGDAGAHLPGTDDEGVLELHGGSLVA